MQTELVLPVAVDLVAIIVLAYGIYFRRYYRRDLLLAYVALNIGVLITTFVLVTAEVGIGLGFGLFGILSIIRLRSTTVTQAGVQPGPQWIVPSFAGLLIVTMYLFDHPRLYSRIRRQTVTLDVAYTDEATLREVLSGLMGGTIKYLVVVDVDLVRDTTVVDVRYRRGKHPVVRSVAAVRASTPAA